LRFAAAGFWVAITDINADTLQAVSVQIAAQGAESLELCADVSDWNACEEISRQVLATWGRIDTLIANAGVQISGGLLAANEDDWTRIIGVNLKGAAYSC